MGIVRLNISGFRYDLQSDISGPVDLRDQTTLDMVTVWIWSNSDPWALWARQNLGII